MIFIKTSTRGVTIRQCIARSVGLIWLLSVGAWALAVPADLVSTPFERLEASGPEKLSEVPPTATVVVLVAGAAILPFCVQ